MRGPAEAGERVRVELPLGAGCVTLRGRILWPDHEPCAEEDLEYRVSDGEMAKEGAQRYASLSVDPERGFALDFSPETWPRTDRVLSLVWQKQPMSASWPDAGYLRRERYPHPLHLAVALDERWRVGSHDLGELVLEEIPLFAAGRVIDARTHRPLGRVSVLVDHHCPRDRIVLTDDEGHFALHALTDAERLELVFIPLGDFVGTHRLARTVDRGTRDLVVELEAP